MRGDTFFAVGADFEAEIGREHDTERAPRASRRPWEPQKIDSNQFIAFKCGQHIRPDMMARGAIATAASGRFRGNRTCEYSDGRHAWNGLGGGRAGPPMARKHHDIQSVGKKLASRTGVPTSPEGWVSPTRNRIRPAHRALRRTRPGKQVGRTVCTLDRLAPGFQRFDQAGSNAQARSTPAAAHDTESRAGNL